MNSKAIFLDRDGVLIDNSYHYYIWKTDQVKLIEGVIANLKLLSERAYHLFIVSNQGGIARKLYSKSDAQQIHSLLLNKFRENGIHITDINFCPHHPEIENCLCRKPQPLMIEKLLAKYKIDPEYSYFIGDSESDMKAASKAGIKGIHIPPNQNMRPFIEQLL